MDPPTVDTRSSEDPPSLVNTSGSEDSPPRPDPPADYQGTSSGIEGSSHTIGVLWPLTEEEGQDLECNSFASEESDASCSLSPTKYSKSVRKKAAKNRRDPPSIDDEPNSQSEELSCPSPDPPPSRKILERDFGSARDGEESTSPGSSCVIDARTDEEAGARSHDPPHGSRASLQNAIGDSEEDEPPRSSNLELWQAIPLQEARPQPPDGMTRLSRDTALYYMPTLDSRRMADPPLFDQQSRPDPPPKKLVEEDVQARQSPERNLTTDTSTGSEDASSENEDHKLPALKKEDSSLSDNPDKSSFKARERL